MMEITNTNRKPTPTDIHVHANKAKPLSSSLVGQDQGKGKAQQTQPHETTRNYSVKARKRKRAETKPTVGRRSNDDAHGTVSVHQATRTRAATAATAAAVAMSPPTLSESESLSDSDGRQTTTVANKWGTSITNRRPLNDPMIVGAAARTPLLSSTLSSSRSRLSLSSESSPELLRHAALLSPSRAGAQANVHAATGSNNSRKDDALLPPSPSLFDILDNNENAKPVMKAAVRTYSKKTKKQRTAMMGSATTPGSRPSMGEEVLKDVSSRRVVSVSLPSTKALGIRGSSPPHPSPGTTSTGVHGDDDKDNDEDDDDDDYEEEEEESASDGQNDGNKSKGSGLGHDDETGDNSNASRGQSKSSDFLQAFYLSQRQLWKEVDEISLEEELVG